MPRPYCYDYPRPMVTVDLVVFGLDGGALRALFIKRKKDPFAGRWAIPGGYVEIDERIEAAARRELKEETGLDAPPLIEPIGVWDAPDRDPRGRTISHPFACAVRPPLPPVSGEDDASEAAWLDPRSAGPLAFDHAEIVGAALRWLARSAEDPSKALALLPESFTRDEARAMRDALLGKNDGASWLARLKRSGAIAEGERGRYSRRSPTQ